LQILGLGVLSRMIEGMVYYLPNLASVALIVGVGFLLATWAGNRIESGLRREAVRHARLLGGLLKGVLLSIVGALALWQLGVAREIVLAAFLILFGAMGISFALAVGLGSARAVQRAWDTLFGDGEK
jgi:uncharacterized membrane protein HdeD (DUF308 family)